MAVGPNKLKVDGGLEGGGEFEDGGGGGLEDNGELEVGGELLCCRGLQGGGGLEAWRQMAESTWTAGGLEL